MGVLDIALWDIAGKLWNVPVFRLLGGPCRDKIWMYPSPKAGYILRGLSAVPQTLRDYWAMANIHYTPGQFVYQFNRSFRAITRPQMELIAARVSALHQCAY